MYLDFEKEEFMNKIVSWINKTKMAGKTDKRIFFITLAFPIDIKIGPPNPIYNKIRLGFIFRLIAFIIYFYIAYR
jgi:hypothetical protein